MDQEQKDIRTTDQPWSPSSWRSFPARQQPEWEQSDELADALDVIGSRPPLVTAWEVERLKQYLAEAASGNRFLLQGGDCAELFEECEPDIIANRLKVLLQMSLVLIYGLGMPVVRVGRFAGQYAKPRSAGMERRKGRELPSYRGDIINSPGFSERERLPDPARMVDAYYHASATLNYIRALGEGGFADLHHPEIWDLEFVEHDSLRQEYQDIVDSIMEALQFMEAVSASPMSEMERVSFFTSHEALLLPWEEVMTRDGVVHPGIYNLSTHFPWIGMRTARRDGAHVEYMRGISNPIGIKVGPEMGPSDLADLVRTLDPERVPGRITLITRLGVQGIETALPPLISAVRAAGHPVLWSCDPMHGNTETLDSGVKTRRFENILAELELAFDIHDACDSLLGGIHLELTGENVTECTGGARGLAEEDLARAYQSQVDPRLNGEQALEMAFAVVRKQRHMRENDR